MRIYKFQSGPPYDSICGQVVESTEETALDAAAQIIMLTAQAEHAIWPEPKMLDFIKNGITLQATPFLVEGTRLICLN